jgi:ankyrin repeat protein
LIVAAQNTARRAMATLIQLGAEIDQQDKEGNKPLHYAVLTVPEKTVEILSMASVDFNILNSNGQTVVHLIALANHFKLAKLIWRQLSLIKISLIDRNGYYPLLRP